MSTPISIRRPAAGRIRVAGATLLTVLALTLPAQALAQDPTEAPAQEPAAGDGSGIEFPLMLGGQLLTAETYSGSEWLERAAEGEGADPGYAERAEALVENAGGTIDDLTVKTALYEPAPGESAVVAAVRVDGADAREFVRDAVDLLVGDVASPELVMRPFGSKWTLRVMDAEMPGVYPRTVYLRDDTAWIIQGDEDLVFEALDQLPDVDPVGALSGDTLVTEVPATLGDRRRIGLYESTEPLFLPTMSERLGPEIDEWLLELYLDAGVSPSEILGVIAWWGLESTQDSIEIEGYRLPDGVDALVEELRSRIFLGEGDEPTSFASMFEGAGRSEQEIAGRTVTTLDFGVTKQHVFSSGDTVWVVTDHVGEPELAEESISVLP